MKAIGKKVIVRNIEQTHEGRFEIPEKYRDRDTILKAEVISVGSLVRGIFPGDVVLTERRGERFEYEGVQYACLDQEFVLLRLEK